MPNQQDLVIEQLMSLDKQTLATRAAKQLGKYQKEIAKRDRLIADLTAQRDKAQREANEILADARRQASLIKQEAQTMKDRSEQRAAEVDAEVDRKINNANAEADSIVETHLSAAQANISVMETRRDEAKRKALVLNNNIRSEYDHMVEKLTQQVSLMKDIQVQLDEMNADIEAEDFKKFDMRDYVTPTVQQYSSSSSFSQKQDQVSAKLDDSDLAVLGGLLKDDFDAMADPEPLEYPDVVQPTYTPNVHHQPQLQVQIPQQPQPAYQPQQQQPVYQQPQQVYQPQQQQPVYQQPQQVYQPQQQQQPPEDDLDAFEDELDFDDLNTDDIDVFDEPASGDSYANGKMKSFTDAFMAVGAQQQQQQNDDIDFDSILDEDDDLEDDDFSQMSNSRLNIPVRPQRSQSSNPARWITK